MSEQLICLSGGPPANRSASRDFAKDLTTREETLCFPLEQWRHTSARSGSSGKTSPVFCPPTEEGTLEPFSGCWRNSGMGSPTGFWTLNTSEWPSDAAVCLLSDILETGDVPPRYSLSPKACLGILRRAEARGRELPPKLRQALLQVAGASNELENPEAKTRL